MQDLVSFIEVFMYPDTSKLAVQNTTSFHPCQVVLGAFGDECATLAWDHVRTFLQQYAMMESSMLTEPTMPATWLYTLIDAHTYRTTN